MNIYDVQNSFPGIFSGNTFEKFMDFSVNSPNSKLYSCASKLPYDIYTVSEDEIEKMWCVEFAVSGIDEDTIKVLVKEDTLSISGEFLDYTKSISCDLLDNTEKPEPIENRKYFHTGISKRNLNTSFTLSTKVDKKNIKWKLNNGVLLVKVPIIADEVFTASRED